MAIQQQIELEGKDSTNSCLESYCEDSRVNRLQSRTICELLTCFPGRSNPEHSLPSQYGRDCRSSNIPPDSRYCQSGLHASHEGLLDHLPDCFGICTEVLARVSVGAILQLHRIRDWNLHQHTHKEEATRCAKEEGRRTLLKHFEFRSLISVAALWRG